MNWLFVLLGAVAVVFFLVLPVVTAVGYLAALLWIAFLLYLVFYRPDPISQAIDEQEA